MDDGESMPECDERMPSFSTANFLSPLSLPHTRRKFSRMADNSPHLALLHRVWRLASQHPPADPFLLVRRAWGAVYDVYPPVLMYVMRCHVLCHYVHYGERSEDIVTGFSAPYRSTLPRDWGNCVQVGFRRTWRLFQMASERQTARKFQP